MLERFDQRSLLAVGLARGEARAMHHGWIGTGHLLLGLMQDGRTPAVRLLRVALPPAAEIQDAVRADGIPEDPERLRNIWFTPEATEVLEQAQELVPEPALITPEDVLSALAAFDGSLAMRLLARYDVDLRLILVAAA